MAPWLLRHAWAVMMLTLATIWSSPAVADTASNCAALKDLKLPHVEIKIATEIVGSFTEDMAVGRPARTYSHLPAFCRVYGVSTPVPGSRIGFEVWMPVRGWSHRLHMIGGGAYVSNISYEDMIPRLDEGDVAVGTDTGHSGTDLKFGWHHRQRIVDFGYRAVHQTAVAAKAVTRAYYRQPAAWSYFSGCSTGGYQALSEAQRYPDDFNGIIAGAPGNNRTNLTLAFLWNYLANHHPGDDANPILSPAALLLINQAVTAACDKLDGVADGVVSYPPACRFDVATLHCRDGEKAGTCLTSAQIAAAEKIYAGPKDARTGQQIYPGYPLGAEGEMASSTAAYPGWSGYWAEHADPEEPSRADLFRYWVFDNPGWNWWRFDWGKDVDAVHHSLSSVFDAVNPNLARFEKRGGKLIMFIGWQDPVGSAYEAINYYRSVEALMPGASEAAKRQAVEQFVHLYMVPGMGHCAGGPGATNFSTATRDSTPPVLDASHDMTRALHQWVEHGKTPEALIATRYVPGHDGTAPAERPIAFQRPICLYPREPTYRGGPANLASSFNCAAPPDRPRP